MTMATTEPIMACRIAVWRDRREREVLYPPLTRVSADTDEATMPTRADRPVRRSCAVQLKCSPGWEKPVEVHYTNKKQRIRAKYIVFQVEPSFG